MGKGLRLLLSGLAEYPFLRLLAPAFWVAWITIFYSGFVIVTSSSSAYDASASLFSVSTFALAATIIVSSFAVDVAWRIISNARTMALIAVVAALCTVLVGFEGVVPDPVYWIAAPLTGVSTACLAMRCAMIYSELEPHRATSLSCFGLVLGSLIYCFAAHLAQYHSALIILIFTALMPLFCAFLSFIPAVESTYAEPDVASKKLSPGFVRLIIFIGFVSFALSSIRGYYPRFLDEYQFSSSRADVAVGLVLLGLVVVGIMACLRKEASLGKFFYGMFIVAVLMVVPIPFLGTFSGYAGTLASVANGVLAQGAWCFLAYWSYRTGMVSIRVFGLGFGLYSAFMALGFLAGDVFAMVISADIAMPAGIIYTLLCVVAAIVLLRPDTLSDLLEPSSAMMAEVKTEFGDATQGSELFRQASFDAELPDGSVKKPGRFMLTCEGIASEYGLSARETEVFIKLAMHKEVKQIAEELFISFNTARTHVRKIYAKLDVHSHKELDELVDSFTLSR